MHSNCARSIRDLILMRILSLRGLQKRKNGDGIETSNETYVAAHVLLY